MSTGKITKKKSGYTIVPNGFLREKELSWKAKGLMTYLLSMAENWELYKKDLANRSKDGYDSMIGGWNELVDAGYIEQVIKRENGQIKGYDYIIHEEPIRDFPESGKPESGNPHLISNSIQELLFKEVDTNVSTFVGLPAAEPTVSFAERCRGFIIAFNEKRIVNGKKSKFQTSESLTNTLKKRLKKYSAGRILKALELAMKDKYHKETNFMYVTPEYILREKILERYLNTIPIPAAAVEPERPIKIDHSSL